MQKVDLSVRRRDLEESYETEDDHNIEATWSFLLNENEWCVYIAETCVHFSLDRFLFRDARHSIFILTQDKKS